MVQNTNQFTMTPEEGYLDESMSSQNVFSCAVSSAQATPLVGGQPVKIEDSAGGVIKVLATTANTDKVFGFVVRNLKDINRTAGESLEIAADGVVMWKVAGGAIARGQAVESVSATRKVIASAGVNPICGWAVDKAAADLDLIRVYILSKTF